MSVGHLTDKWRYIYISILRGKKRSKEISISGMLKMLMGWYFQAEQKRTSGVGAAAESISIKERVS